MQCLGWNPKGLTHLRQVPSFQVYHFSAPSVTDESLPSFNKYLGLGLETWLSQWSAGLTSTEHHFVSLSVVLWSVWNTHRCTHTLNLGCPVSGYVLSTFHVPNYASLFWDRVSYSPGWPCTYVAEDDLELSWFSCLYLPKAEMAGMCEPPTLFIWCWRLNSGLCAC